MKNSNKLIYVGLALLTIAGFFLSLKLRNIEIDYRIDRKLKQMTSDPVAGADISARPGSNWILNNNVLSPRSSAWTVSSTNISFSNVTTTNLAVTGQFSLPVGGVALENLSVVNAGRTASTTIASDYISVGAGPASSGLIRIPNNQGLVSRNAANTGDLAMLYVDSINRLLIGNAANANLFVGDVGFANDNTYDIGGGQRSPRMIFARTNITAGTTTNFATLAVAGVGSANPFEVRSSTGVSNLKILTNGNVGVNSSTPIYKLAVQGTVGAVGLTTATNNDLCINATTGEFTDAGGSTCLASVREKKDNIRDIGVGISELMKLSPRNFEWKDSGKTDMGLVADEVEKVIPYLVNKDKNGKLLSVNYEQMSALLIESIQAQQKEIEILKRNQPNKNQALIGLLPWVLAGLATVGLLNAVGRKK